MPTRFLLFGVSASGKTSLCREIASTHDNVVHVSASRIYQQSLQESSLDQDTPFFDRQVHICKRIKTACDEASRKVCLVDGHLYVADVDAWLPVPTEAVAELQLTALLHLDTPADIVSKRRRQLGNSRGAERQVREEMAGEASTGETIALALGLPILQITATGPLAASHITGALGLAKFR